MNTENKALLNVELKTKDLAISKIYQNICISLYALFDLLLKEPIDNFWIETFSLIYEYLQLIIYSLNQRFWIFYKKDNLVTNLYSITKYFHLVPFISQNRTIYLIIINFLIVLILFILVLLIIKIFQLQRQNEKYNNNNFIIYNNNINYNDWGFNLLKIFLPLFSFTFYLPILLILTTPFICSNNNNKNNENSLNYEFICSDNNVLYFLKVLSGITIIFHFIISLIVNFFYYQPNFLKGGSNILKKNSSVPSVIFLITKIIISMHFLLNKSNNSQKYKDLFLLLLLYSIINSYFIINFQLKENRYLLLINNSLSVILIWSFLSLFISYIFFNIGFDGEFFLFISGSFIILFFFSLQKRKNKKIIYKNFYELSSSEECLLYIEKFVKIIQKKNKNRKSDFILKYLIEESENNCINSDCPLKKFNECFEGGRDYFFLLYIYVKELYEISIAKFPEDVNLKLNYITFLSIYLKKNKSAKILLNSISFKINNNQKFLLKFLKGYNIYRCQKLIEEYSSETFFSIKDDNDKKNNDIVNVIKYKDYENLFKNKIFEISTLYYNFWSSLLGSYINGNEDFKNLNDIGAQINNLLGEIEKLFNKLQEIKKNDIKIIKLYTGFIKEILNDNDKFLKYNKILLNLMTNGQKEKKDINYTNFDENSLINNSNNNTNNNSNNINYNNEEKYCLIVSANNKNLGTILYMSVNLSPILGYKKQELEGKNIQVLIPDIYKESHKKLLKERTDSTKLKFYDSVSRGQTYRPEFIESTVLSKNKTKLLVPIDLKIYFVYSENNENLYIIEVSKEVSFPNNYNLSGEEPCCLVLTDKFFNIQILTANCLSFLGLNSSYCDSNFDITANIKNFQEHFQSECLEYSLIDKTRRVSDLNLNVFSFIDTNIVTLNNLTKDLTIKNQILIKRRIVKKYYSSPKRILWTLHKVKNNILNHQSTSVGGINKKNNNFTNSINQSMNKKLDLKKYSFKVQNPRELLENYSSKILSQIEIKQSHYLNTPNFNINPGNNSHLKFSSDISSPRKMGRKKRTNILYNIEQNIESNGNIVLKKKCLLEIQSVIMNKKLLGYKFIFKRIRGLDEFINIKQMVKLNKMINISVTFDNDNNDFNININNINKRRKSNFSNKEKKYYESSDLIDEFDNQNNIENNNINNETKENKKDNNNEKNKNINRISNLKDAIGKNMNKFDKKENIKKSLTLNTVTNNQKKNEKFKIIITKPINAVNYQLTKTNTNINPFTNETENNNNNDSILEVKDKEENENEIDVNYVPKSPVNFYFNYEKLSFTKSSKLIKSQKQKEIIRKVAEEKFEAYQNYLKSNIDQSSVIEEEEDKEEEDDEEEEGPEIEEIEEIDEEEIDDEDNNDYKNYKSSIDVSSINNANNENNIRIDNKKLIVDNKIKTIFNERCSNHHPSQYKYFSNLKDEELPKKFADSNYKESNNKDNSNNNHINNITHNNNFSKMNKKTQSRKNLEYQRTRSRSNSNIFGLVASRKQSFTKSKTPPENYYKITNLNKVKLYLYDYKTETIMVQEPKEKTPISQVEIIINEYKSKNYYSHIGDDPTYPTVNISFSLKRKVRIESASTTNSKYKETPSSKNMILSSISSTSFNIFSKKDKEKQLIKEVNDALSREDEQKTIKIFSILSILCFLVLLGSGVFSLYYILYSIDKLRKNLRVIVNATTLRYYSSIGTYFIRELTLLNLEKIPEIDLDNINKTIYTNIPAKDKENYLEKVKKNTLKTFLFSHSLIESIIGSDLKYSSLTSSSLLDKPFITKTLVNNSITREIETSFTVSMVQINAALYNLATYSEPVRQNNSNIYVFMHNSLNNMGEGIRNQVNLLTEELNKRINRIKIFVIIYNVLNLIIILIIYIIIIYCYIFIIKKKTSYIEIFFGIELLFIKNSALKCEIFLGKQKQQDYINNFYLEEKDKELETNSQEDPNLNQESSLGQKIDKFSGGKDDIIINKKGNRINGNNYNNNRRMKKYLSFNENKINETKKNKFFKIGFLFFLIICYIYLFLVNFFYMIYSKKISSLAEYGFHMQRFQNNILTIFNGYRELLFDNGTIVTNKTVNDYLKEKEISILSTNLEDNNYMTFHLNDIPGLTKIYNEYSEKSLCSYKTYDYFESEEECINFLHKTTNYHSPSTFFWFFCEELREKRNLIKYKIDHNLICGNLTNIGTHLWDIDSVNECLHENKNISNNISANNINEINDICENINKKEYRLSLFNDFKIHAQYNVIFSNSILPYLEELRNLTMTLILDYTNNKGGIYIFALIFYLCIIFLLSFFYWIKIIRDLKEDMFRTKNMLKIIPTNILASQSKIKQILNINSNL